MKSQFTDEQFNTIVKFVRVLKQVKDVSQGAGYDKEQWRMIIASLEGALASYVSYCVNSTKKTVTFRNLEGNITRVVPIEEMPPKPGELL